MIIPDYDKTIVRIYKCPKCDGYYLEGRSVNCSIDHLPGSCCHYADLSLSLKEVEKVLEIVGSKKIYTTCWEGEARHYEFSDVMAKRVTDSV